MRFQATVVASDGYLDLAVVKITKTASGAIVDGDDLDVLTQIGIGDSDAVKTGDPIRVVGYPGIAATDAPNMTSGEISSPTSDDRLNSTAPSSTPPPTSTTATPVGWRSTSADA